MALGNVGRRPSALRVSPRRARKTLHPLAERGQKWVPAFAGPGGPRASTGRRRICAGFPASRASSAPSVGENGA